MGTTLLKGEGTDTRVRTPAQWKWGINEEREGNSGILTVKKLWNTWAWNKKSDGVLVLVQGKNEAGFNFISTKREKK